MSGMNVPAIWKTENCGATIADFIAQGAESLLSQRRQFHLGACRTASPHVGDPPVALTVMAAEQKKQRSYEYPTKPEPDVNDSF
ncbi:hypothetical protein ACEWPL_016885 [Roseovarius sp. S1116L3]